MPLLERKTLVEMISGTTSGVQRFIRAEIDPESPEAGTVVYLSPQHGHIELAEEWMGDGNSGEVLDAGFTSVRDNSISLIDHLSNLGLGHDPIQRAETVRVVQLVAGPDIRIKGEVKVRKP